MYTNLRPPAAEISMKCNRWFRKSEMYLLGQDRIERWNEKWQKTVHRNRVDQKDPADEEGWD